MVETSTSKSLVLSLIAEELKIQKVLAVLRELGLSDCEYQFHMDEIILTTMGLNPDSDEVIERYMRIIEKTVSKLKPRSGRWGIVKESEKIYRELNALKLGI